MVPFPKKSAVFAHQSAPIPVASSELRCAEICKSQPRFLLDPTVFESTVASVIAKFRFPGNTGLLIGFLPILGFLFVRELRHTICARLLGVFWWPGEIRFCLGPRPVGYLQLGRLGRGGCSATTTSWERSFLFQSVVDRWRVYTSVARGKVGGLYDARTFGRRCRLR